jgi:precorrin-6Y C5,15-methyltransferase (decarboxylating)
MNAVIHVIGMGADEVPPRAALREIILQADFLAGGERHHRAFPTARGERFVLKDNVRDLLTELRKDPFRRCVVLASGDPLFYGIGTILAGAFGPEELRVEPALSSMQLAFARAGLAWQDAALASIHGRDVRTTLLPLLGRPLIGLFTQDGAGPADVARFFRRYGLVGYEAVVAENLGADDERVSRWPDLERLEGQRFGALNYLVLRRTAYPVDPAEARRNRALVPGVPDEVFARPGDEPEVMTRQEVRAVVLAKLLGPTDPGDILWDVGAGLGTVSVEAAALRPHVEVIAVERAPARAAFLRRNRDRFDACNVRLIEGEAPEALTGEDEPPRFVFVGGSGGRLCDILDLARTRLRPGGRLLGSFVTLEHVTRTVHRLQEWDWPLQVTEVHVSRSDALAGLTGLKPFRGVFLIGATKPEEVRA